MNNVILKEANIYDSQQNKKYNKCIGYLSWTNIPWLTFQEPLFTKDFFFLQ